jgi:hypothetical protein
VSEEKTAVEELAELEAAEAEEARVAKIGKAEADARQEIANRKIIKDLRAKIPTPIHRIDTDAGMVVIKRVSLDQYRAFVRTVLDEDQRVRANEVLTAAAVVHPDPDTWDAWCQAYPALIQSVSKAVVVFNGGTVKEKKL